MSDDPKPARGADGRFVKGTSGNRQGRPPGRKNRDAQADAEEQSPIEFVMEMPSGATHHGRELSTKETLQQSILKRAFEGDRKAIRTVLGWIRKRQKAREAIARRRARKQPQPEQDDVIKPIGPRSNEALKLLDIVKVSENDHPGPKEWLVIQHWAAQLAIRRSRNLAKLDADDISLIRCQVERADELNLPEGADG